MWILASHIYPVFGGLVIGQSGDGGGLDENFEVWCKASQKFRNSELSCDEPIVLGCPSSLEYGICWAGGPKN